MKAFNLIVNYYNDKVEARTRELNYCLLANIQNENISNIIVICTEADYKNLQQIVTGEQKLIPIITDVRPTFNDYFKIISKLFNDENNINIVANLDIIIPAETLVYSSFYMPTKNTCLALTRWDIIGADTTGVWENSIQFYDHADSQDVWFFVGGVPQIADADFTLGIAGCDNKIAYLLEVNGYNVLNPSRKLKTIHFHLTDIRNYKNAFGQVLERLQPPYKILPPTD